MTWTWFYSSPEISGYNRQPTPAPPPPKTTEQQPGFLVVLVMCVTLLLLMSAPVACVVLLASHDSVSVTVPASSGLCPAGRDHSECVERVVVEKLVYLKIHFPKASRIESRGDQPLVVFEIKEAQETEVCSLEVTQYFGRVAMLGAKDCGHSLPVTIPPGEPS